MTGRLDRPAERSVRLLTGLVMFGLAMALLLEAGTGLASRGIPVGVARAGIELTVLVAGWLLGGTVGLGTVAFALAIGPLVHRTLPWLSMDGAAPARRVGHGQRRAAASAVESRP